MDDLSRAQADLARALDRARAGEDRDLAQKVREAGEQVAQLLAGLLKLTRVHGPENRAFDAPAAEFARALGTLVGLLGTVHLVCVEDQVYVNDVRIKTEGKGGARDLGGDLARHGAGGLSFHASLADREVRELVRMVSAPAAGEGPRAVLAERLRGAGVATVDVAGPFRFRMEGEAERADRPDLLRRLLGLVGESVGSVAAGRALNPLPLRRTVLEILDAGAGAPAFWGGLPSDAAPHAAHAVEVAMVSLLVAQAAGFPAAFVQDLGIAALLHDVGYLSPGLGFGAEAFARHPLEGARAVLRQRGFHEAKVRRLRAVLEHHRDHATPQARPSPGGAILRLAEDYSTVTRLYGAKVLRAQVVGAMLQAAGTLYHPVLAQVLANALGLHPPGTLVELEDGRLARVGAPARSPALWDKPLVRVLDPATRQPGAAWLDTAQEVRVRRALPG